MGFDLILITNAPGELSAWVKPVISQFNKLNTDLRIIISLVPCPYSSKQEERVAKNFQNVNLVLNDIDTCKFILTSKLPSNFKFREKGVVVHLGGDQMFSVLMKMKTKFPIVVYTDNHILWKKYVDKYLFADKMTYAKARLKGISAEKLSIVGNLMVDAVKTTMDSSEARLRLGLRTDKVVISLLPGSKPFKVRYSTPFMLKIADYIAKKIPDAQFIISQSPYTPLYDLVGSVSDKKCVSVLDGTFAKFGRTENGNVLVTTEGTTINIIPSNFQYEAYQVSDVCITLPGTNTAELGVIGAPMVTVLPLNNIKYIPLEGFVGRIADLPLIGSYIKSKVAKYILEKHKFVSIPNQKAGSFITPELIGNIHPIKVAEEAIKILENPYEKREMSINLKKVMSDKNVSEKVVGNILSVLLSRFKDMGIKLEHNDAHWFKK